ncbi:MAG: glycosyltransferase family 39 protein [bacterium]
MNSSLRRFADLWCLSGLLVLAALLRWWYYLEIKDTTLFTVPLLDSRYYLEWTEQLLAGDWGRGEPYFMGPLYPHLLALIYTVAGSGGAAAQLVQWGCNLATIVLVYLLTRKCADRPTACLAATLLVGYGPLMFYSGLLLMAAPLTLLVVLVVWQATRALQTPTRRRWFGLGLLVGLAGLTRGNMLLLLVTLPVLLWRPSPPLPRRRLLLAMLLLGGCVCVLPVAVRNHTIGGDSVLVTSNVGWNLYLGQQPEYLGLFAHGELEHDVGIDITGKELLVRELGRDLRPSEVSRIYSRRALQGIVSQPVAMLAHFARKAYRFWSGYELPQLAAYDFHVRSSHLLRWLPVPYTLLAAGGLLGLLMVRGRTRWLLLIVFVTYFLSLLPFFPTARYRQPIVPLLALSTALYLMTVWRDLRAGRRRPGLVKVGGLLLLMLALLPRWSALNPDHVAWQAHLHAAARSSLIDDEQGVMREIMAANQVIPDFAVTFYKLGTFCDELGRYDKSLAAYQRAESLAPDDRELPYRIGCSFQRLGQLDEADLAFRRCSRLDSTWARPYFGLGTVASERGDLESAIDWMARAVAAEPGAVHYRNNLASLLAEAGRFSEARERLQALLADFPAYARGWLNLTLLEINSGDPAAARGALRRTRELPRLTPAEHDMLRQLEAAVP